MKHYQILIATAVVSNPFPGPDAAFSSGASFYVRLQGTVNGDWDIESALADVAPSESGMGNRDRRDRLYVR